MGYRTAVELAEALPRDRAVETHLTHNFYPPVPAALAPTCIKAIEAIEEEEPGRLIPLAVGSWRGYEDKQDDQGRFLAPADRIAERFRLGAFIDLYA